MLQQRQIHLCEDYHLSGKVILIKRNHQFNLGFFFKWQLSFSHMLRLFKGRFIFREANLFTFLQRNYFDTTVTFSELSMCSSFPEQPFLRRSYFFEQLLFQSEFSTEQSPLENRKFFRIVTFRNSYLFDEGIVQNKYIYRRATFLKMIPLYSINFFRRATFQKKANFSGKQYSALPTFPGELIFQSVYFFKRRYLLQQLPFQKSYFFLQHTYSEE